jgi:hypothetical protein
VRDLAGKGCRGQLNFSTPRHWAESPPGRRRLGGWPAPGGGWEVAGRRSPSAAWRSPCRQPACRDSCPAGGWSRSQAGRRRNGACVRQAAGRGPRPAGGGTGPESGRRLVAGPGRQAAGCCPGQEPESGEANTVCVCSQPKAGEMTLGNGRSSSVFRPAYLRVRAALPSGSVCLAPNPGRPFSRLWKSCPRDSEQPPPGPWMDFPKNGHLVRL